ncbi:DUF4349 domain-containing protein [Agromyces seonyuensis]|uniref:DUF4349 domain-containing protein n=1 Tax=Agromyces seonyuensis TaxID=2662446 RepID=A0A6I4P189_9MICO|nr:DUF4349 domain-containing protein [Agromyces seonyuensis]MWB96987.1 DUF4349 domain-containing protein [Agromyces seonyuensis]
MTSRIVPTAVAAVLLLGLLSGCSASGASDAVGPEAGGYAESGASAGSAGLPAEAVGSDESEGAPVADRSVVTTGRASVTVEDPIAGAETAVGIVTEAGGRVESRRETPGTDSRDAYAELVLRIPADAFEATLTELRALGSVNDLSLDAADVTAQRADLGARVDALQASVDRLTALLGQAGTTRDLIEIEAEITTRQAELDSLARQRDVLVDQVEYSSLALELVTVEAAPVAAAATFLDGLAGGWAALLAFGGALAVAFGAMLPWLVVAGILAGIVLAVIRATKAARAARAAKAEQGA